MSIVRQVKAFFHNAKIEIWTSVTQKLTNKIKHYLTRKAMVVDR